MTFRELLLRHPVTSLLAAACLPLTIFVVAMLFIWQHGEVEFQLAADETVTLSKYDDHLLALDKEAVDNAYRDQIEHLIAIWFKDDSGQPGRAINGVHIARKRYIDMQAALEKREADLNKLKALQR
jgi:hypothetical protein